MIRAALLAAILAVVAVATHAAPPAAVPGSGDDLAKVPSKLVDEFYVRPGADLTAYRRIVIEAPAVEFQKGWLKRMNETRDVTRWIRPQDAEQIAGDLAGALRRAVADAFTARGFEVVPSPGPGVLRLSPSATDVFVNAPDIKDPGIQIGVVHDEAGDATLRMELRDGASGVLIARVVDRNAARQVGRFDRATSVSNLFWFEAMFRSWATNCAREIASVPAP